MSEELVANCFQYLNLLCSVVPPCPEPSPRLQMATLVLHERIHPEEDGTSDCHGRESNSLGKFNGDYCLQ